MTGATVLLLSALLQAVPVEQPAIPSDSQQAIMTQDGRSADELVPSAMIEEPPSATKLELIRRYLQATGMQRRIDTGSFLERYAFPGGPLTEATTTGRETISFRDVFRIPMAALRRAYEPYRHVWQEEYERHLNWEYTEGELRQIVAFLETDAGRHYLEGEWRMNAYIGTNTEGLLDQIVREAEADIRASSSDRQQ